VFVRSLHVCRQARQRTMRYPSVVRRAISVVVGAAQYGHSMVPSPHIVIVL